MKRMNPNKNHYPSSYDEMRIMAEYLKKEAQQLSYFVKANIKTLNEKLSSSLVKGRSPIKSIRSDDIQEWMLHFANLNQLFLIKYLELFYGVCCKTHVKDPTGAALLESRQSTTSFLSFDAAEEDIKSDYLNKWTDRVHTNWENANAFFYFTKRCCSWFEHYYNNRNNPDRVRLVSDVSSTIAKINTNSNY